MNIKFIKIEKGFVTTKDNSICIFFPERNTTYEYFKNTHIEKYDICIISYYNTFKQLMIFYVENFQITEIMDELKNDVYVYGQGDKNYFIDKKEMTFIKRKSIIKNLLNIKRVI